MTSRNGALAALSGAIVRSLHHSPGAMRKKRNAGTALYSDPGIIECATQSIDVPESPGLQPNAGVLHPVRSRKGVAGEICCSRLEKDTAEMDVPPWQTVRGSPWLPAGREGKLLSGSPVSVACGFAPSERTHVVVLVRHALVNRRVGDNVDNVATLERL